MGVRPTPANLRRPIQSPRQPSDRPLPGLDLPDVPASVESVYEARERAIRQSTQRLSARKLFASQLLDYDRETQPPYEHREIVVRFVLGGDRVGAVVDWRDSRVGGAGLLRRVSGPLSVDGRTLRSSGPGVALLGLVRALEKVATNL